MIIDVNEWVPLVTILAAAAAPTIAAIWAEGNRAKDAKRAAGHAELVATEVAEVKHTLTETSITSDEKLEHIRRLVNSQLSEAIDRLAVANGEIVELRKTVEALKKRLYGKS